MKNLTLNAISVLVLMMINAITLKAQKLPNTQERPVTIPSDVKVDGILNEWSNKLQAFNKSTDIYYTLAHDKQNLYLAVQASDIDIIKKIMKGGVRLTICTSGQRNDPDPLTVTFPVFPADYERSFTYLFNKYIDAGKNKGNTDSIVNVINKTIASGQKQIKIKGFKAINDSLISIYNTQGMKAMTLIDNKAVFTYELIVPLELIEPIARKEIAYNIMLTGETAVVRKPSTFVGVTVMANRSSRTVNQSVFYPTDFWGKYKLTD